MTSLTTTVSLFILSQCLILSAAKPQSDTTEQTAFTQQGNSTAVSCGSKIDLLETWDQMEIMTTAQDENTKCLVEFSLSESSSFLELELLGNSYKLESDPKLEYHFRSQPRSKFLPKETTTGQRVSIEASSFSISWTVQASEVGRGFVFNYKEYPKNVISLSSSMRETTIELPKESKVNFTKNTEVRIFLMEKDNREREGAFTMLHFEPIKLNPAVSDYILIGPGNSSNSMEGSQGLMLTSELKKGGSFRIADQDAFVFFVRLTSDSDDMANFKVHVFRKFPNNLGTDAPIDRPVTRPPITGAGLEEALLCFKNIPDDCTMFSNNRLRNFQRTLGDYAEKFAYQERINLPTSGGIRPEQVQVECFYQNATKGYHYVTVVIVSPLDKEKAIFTREQFKGILNAFQYEITRELKFEVGECMVYPDYWLWFWGGLAFFIIGILVLSMAWFVAYSQSIREKEMRRKGVQSQLNFDEKHTVNAVYVDDEGFYQQQPMETTDVETDVEINTEEGRFIGQEDAQINFDPGNKPVLMDPRLEKIKQLDDSFYAPVEHKSQVTEVSMPPSPPRYNKEIKAIKPYQPAPQSEQQERSLEIFDGKMSQRQRNRAKSEDDTQL